MKKILFIFLCFIISRPTVNARNIINLAQLNTSSAIKLSDTGIIVAGTSRLTGRIISPGKENNISIAITVPHPISGEYVQYKATADQSGKFSIDVDVETNISFVGLNVSLNPEKGLLIKLTSGGVTNLDITYNSSFNIGNIDISPLMNPYDITQSLEIMGNMIEYRPDRAPKILYNKTTDDFLNHAKASLTERLTLVKNDSQLSQELKGLLSRDYRLFLYNVHVFDYKKEMVNNYGNSTGDRINIPVIQKIERPYFRFLKDFNLNDLQYLYGYTFSEFQKTILQNEIIGLPVIGESDIPSWLASVKIILSDLVGFKEGPYYDILAANAYARQLNEEVKPLTDKQKQHILNYWKNGEIAKILFRKNEKVIGLNSLKSPLVVHNISSVPDDKLIETIISKYKGKVIFIDLWATWCVPCLDAMQEFRSTKNELKDKDVVFVYLTNGSSPQKLWEEKIKGIGDEHYYLTASQWSYMMDKYGFNAIPSYLLFNKEALLINKFTAFPGSVEVKQMIKALL